MQVPPSTWPRQILKPQRLVNTEQYHQALQSVDYKFLLIPVAFVILRIWSCITVAVFIYAGLQVGDIKDKDKPLLRTLIVLSVSHMHV